MRSKIIPLNPPSTAAALPANRSPPSPPKVADAEVEYKNISIQGPNGLRKTSSVGDMDHGPPQGIMSLGCVKDVGNDRLLDNLYRFADLTPEVRRLPTTGSRRYHTMEVPVFCRLSSAVVPGIVPVFPVGTH